MARITAGTKLFAWRCGGARRSSTCQLCTRSNEDSEEVRRAYRTGWKRWLGAPSFLWCDAARWNTGLAMRRGCEQDGTFLGQAVIAPDEQRIITVGGEGGIFIWKVPDEFQGAGAAA